MDKQESPKKWLTSQEARKVLKVSGCTLMHLRETGALKFKKSGNAYYYLLEDQDKS